MILVSSLISSLQKELWSFNSTEQHPDMYRYINSAINYIYNYRDWDWNRYQYQLSYTTPGVEQSLSIYPYKVFYVKSGTKLINVMDYESWFLMQDDIDDAVCCYRDKFVANSSWIYTLLYSKTAPVIAPGDTEIDIPDYYTDVLQIIAIHYAYKDIKDYETAWALIWQAKWVLWSATERTVNSLPRNTVRLWSSHNF
jgi:hypothetical protein